MANNDTKTWIGSTGPFLSDSSKPISGLQTDKPPTSPSDVITDAYAPDSIAKAMHGAPNKATPVNADEFSIADSVSTPTAWKLKRVSWSSVLATAKAYFDSIYVNSVSATAPVASSGGTAPVISIPAATASVDGYMTQAYATKLDAITGTNTGDSSGHESLLSQNGISGSFTTVDLKTVTVVNGQITSIV